MSKHLATAERKNSPLTGRNLRQTPALGGRPSTLTGWVEIERERERRDGGEGDREGEGERERERGREREKADN